MKTYAVPPSWPFWSYIIVTLLIGCSVPRGLGGQMSSKLGADLSLWALLGNEHPLGGSFSYNDNNFFIWQDSLLIQSHNRRSEGP